MVNCDIVYENMLLEMDTELPGAPIDCPAAAVANILIQNGQRVILRIGECRKVHDNGPAV